MIEQAVIVGLAAWRVASMLVIEEGPFGVFERLRSAIGVPEEGEISGVVPKLLSCIWCSSVWTAAGFWGLWELWRPEPVIVVAAMALPVLAERWMGRS